MAEQHSSPLLEADEIPAVTDGDSSVGEDTASSTQSITSSILDYRRENGRTYHGYKDGRYIIPNDEIENERLDLQHHLFLLTFENSLGLAPPNQKDAKSQRVLDVGTGTGIWAIDYADDHPDAEVIGIDLSPIQPGFIPPNVRFVIDDLDEEWTYSQPFNYIHSRMMNGSIKNWSEYFRKCYDNLAPGGYFEVQDISVLAYSDDATLTEDSNFSKWMKLLYDASIKAGVPVQGLDNFKGLLKDAGFVNIVDSRFKWPSNPWPKDKKHKELGIWHNENMSTALEAISMALYTRVLGWSHEEVTVFLSKVRQEINDSNIHAYWPIISVYGQKPEVDSAV